MAIGLVRDVEKTVNSRNLEFEGERRHWPYSKESVVVRHINCYDDKYPTIKGEDINGITITDYKVEVCWKDESKPSLIFLLKEDFIDTD